MTVAGARERGQREVGTAVAQFRESERFVSGHRFSDAANRVSSNGFSQRGALQALHLPWGSRAQAPPSRGSLVLATA